MKLRSYLPPSEKLKRKLEKRLEKKPVTPIEAIQEAKRYYENAKEILKRVVIQYGRYSDAKPVREACGIAYISSLFAIDSYILSKGIKWTELPTSYDGYWDWLSKVPHNGKLKASLNTVYENLHILGYYRGGVGVAMIKEGFAHARSIIDTFDKILHKNPCGSVWIRG